MPQQRTTMMEPPIEVLMDKVGSKFGLVALAAMRGRQINSYYNQLGQGVGTLIPPQVASVARKPLSIAFEEIAADKIVPVWDAEKGSDAHEDASGDLSLSASDGGSVSEEAEGAVDGPADDAS
jgi:DNA-directed RNA polymerase subunit omega